MTVQAILARGQADAIEASFEVWRTGEMGASSDLAALLAAAMHLTDQVGRWQEESWKRLFSGDRSFDFQAHGSALAEVYSRCRAVFDRLEDSLEGVGADVEGIGTFRAARQSLAALNADFLARWPLFTVEELDEGAAEIARGECVTLEEAIRELGAPPRS
jgi:hypothetical protein